MKLPELPYRISKASMEIPVLRGINFSDNIKDGDMSDSRNISTRRYPYTATRHGRDRLTDYDSVTAIAYWGALVAVKGTDLIYNGNVVGEVSEGEKQFAVVNTKLVIWPDKKYLDLKTLTLKDLGASITISGTATFTANNVSFKSVSTSLSTLFKKGDCITISGCTENKDNNKDVVIVAAGSKSITVSDDAFTEGTETGGITIERKIPDMDYICESENRLWGCSSAAQTIYASSLGDPTNFFVYEGVATDSYALAVGSEGDFTGCCKLSSSVLFWKETKLHKLLGSYPAEYALYSYDIEGLRKGCSKSIQVINEVLFYMGLHGVYAYSGGTPKLISSNFGSRQFSDGISGSDGDSYYLSVKEGNDSYLFVYETNYGIWILEDNTSAVDFARNGRDLYMLDSSGHVWLMDSGKNEPGIEWIIQFTPFYETIKGRKSYSSLLIRLELPKGSYITAYVRYDGGKWKEAGTVKGAETDTVHMRLGINRCDKFEIKLKGKGPCTILNITREASIRSTK